MITDNTTQRYNEDFDKCDNTEMQGSKLVLNVESKGILKLYLIMKKDISSMDLKLLSRLA